MVRHSSRSRGCKTCRRRKVKCDENFPECTQCSIRGQKCPGPVVGTIFVDMRPKTETQAGVQQNQGSTSQDPISRRTPRTTIRHKPPGETRTAPGDVSGDHVNQIHIDRPSCVLKFQPPLRLGHSGNERSCDSTATNLLTDPSPLQLPPSPPSPAEPFDQLFLAHYIESFNNPGNQPAFWFNRLPELLTWNVSPSVKHAIRSVGMVFYGILTGSVPIQTAACRSYAKAVRSLRSQLQRSAVISLEDGELLTNHVVCAPIMMCMFEIMASTSPVAWIQHIEAAATILLKRGPENCVVGLDHQMFLTVRLFMLFVSMTTNKPHPFTSQSWLTTPFETRLKNANDELVDILISLPSCLSLANELSNQNGSKLNDMKTKLQSCVLDLIFRLDDWHQRFCGKATGPDVQRHYRTAHMAVFMAIYDAGNLIAFQLLSLVLLLTHEHNERIHFHSKSILCANAFVESNGAIAPAGGSLLMVFPLKVLSVWAPLEEQRNYAIKKLLNWDREGESQSICRFAAPVLLGNRTTISPSNVYFADVAAKMQSLAL